MSGWVLIFVMLLMLSSWFLMFVQFSFQCFTSRTIANGIACGLADFFVNFDKSYRIVYYSCRYEQFCCNLATCVLGFSVETISTHCYCYGYCGCKDDLVVVAVTTRVIVIANCDEL